MTDSSHVLPDERPLMDPPPKPLAPGVPFGDKYEIVEIIGRGGMGIVYKARDRELGRDVAIKFLQAAEADDLARFQREAQLVARLSHPSIAAVYELGMHDGRPFLAMQAIEGATLDGAAELPLRDVCTAIRDAARAVQFAHDHRIIHRDLKPGNIMVEGAGPTLRTYVLDFGLARTVGHGTTISVTGDIIGTPAYMSPEQAAGETERVGPLSDVYALGATCYDAATGHAPFVADNPARVLLKVLDSEPVPPRRLNPRIHVDVETIVLKAMDKRPERRYASAGAMADDLDRFLRGEPIEARRLSWIERAARRVRRNLPLAVAVTALLLAVVAGGTALVVQRIEDAREREAMAIRQQEAQRRRHNALYHVQGAARLVEQLLDYKNRYGLAEWKLAAYEPRVIEALDRAASEDAETPEIYAWRGMWHHVAGRDAEAAADLDRACALDPGSLVARYLRGRFGILRMVGTGMMPVSRTTGSGVELGAVRVPGGEWQRRVQEDFLHIRESMAARGAVGLTGVETGIVEAMLLFFQADRTREARDRLDALIDEWPWVMELHLYRSYVNTVLGEYAAAVRDLDTLARVWFENGAVNFFRASFRLNAILEAERQGVVDPAGYDDAIRDFTEALKIEPVPANVYAGRAVAWMRKGHLEARAGADPYYTYRRAMEDFERALSIEPNDYFVLNNRAGLHRRLAEPALEDPEEHLAAGIADVTRGIAIAEALLEAGDPDPNQQREVRRNSGLLYTTRATILRAVGDARWRDTGDPEPYFGHALADLAEAVERYPEYAIAYFCRAQLRFAYREHPDADAVELLGAALDDCASAAERDPEFRQATALRAQVLRHLAREAKEPARLDEALAAFADVADLAADDPALGFEYASALIDRAEPSRDEALLRRAVEVATASLQRAATASLYDARAWACWMLYQAGREPADLRQAERDYAAEATLAPTEARVWANLAEVRYFLEAWDGALEAIDRALALSPLEKYRTLRERIERGKKDSDF